MIEEIFPVKEVNKESTREKKNIRQGHISTLHIWWARRPLAASRAVVYASLVDYNRNKAREHLSLLRELVRWETVSPKSGATPLVDLISKAREDILNSYGGRPPKVLDCFAGGGSIPLEAMRLGCDTYAIEYNPVAYIILKATLEYPAKYGKKLVEDVEKWGNWVLEKAEKELAEFYKDPVNGEEVVGYIWMRTVKCPYCGGEIPLAKQFWLAKKDKKKVGLVPIPNKERGIVEFEIKDVTNIPKEEQKKYEKTFSEGTASGGKAKCLLCGQTVGEGELKNLFQSGQAGERLVVVITTEGKGKGKKYRLATEKDFALFEAAKRKLEELIPKLREKWGIWPVPDEYLPIGDSRAIFVWLYGYDKWGKLFNARQLLALLTFTDLVREACKEMLKEGYEKEYAKAVTTYLALWVSKMADICNAFCQWRADHEAVNHLFVRNALPMLWDYGECQPFRNGTGYRGSLKLFLSSLVANANVKGRCVISIDSATSLPFADKELDAIVTDPPYYDNVPYSDLSDFFYVWLKRSIGDLYPDVFLTELTPKEEEIVVNPAHGKDKKFFEEMMFKALQEMKRVLKDDGIVAIFYTHKSLEGWMALIRALIRSNFVITAAWPIHTEMTNRLRAQASAALASSIVLVGRKKPKKEIGIYQQIEQEALDSISKEAILLHKEGIKGVDLRIALIGKILSVVTKYQRILDTSGREMDVEEIIERLERKLLQATAKKLIGNIATEIDQYSLFYFSYLLEYGDASVDFDTLRKLVLGGFNMEVDDLLKKRLVNVVTATTKKKYYELATSAMRKLTSESIKDSSIYIDVVHALLYALRTGKDEKCLQGILEASNINVKVLRGYVQSLYQAIPENVGEEMEKEKNVLSLLIKTLERLRITESVGKPKQQKLFDEK